MRDNKADHQDAGHRENRRDPEDTGHTNQAVEHGAQYHGKRKRQADAHANQRHCLDAVLLTGQVCNQRHDRRGDGACALQGTPEDYHVNGFRLRRDHAAQGEYQQAADDDRLATDPVREHTGGYLQQCLGDAVGADGEPGQGGRHILQVTGIQGEHRQDQEQTQHPEGIDAGKRECGTKLRTAHAAALPGFRVVIHHCFGRRWENAVY